MANGGSGSRKRVWSGERIGLKAISNALQSMSSTQRGGGGAEISPPEELNLETRRVRSEAGASLAPLLLDVAQVEQATEALGLEDLQEREEQRHTQGGASEEQGQVLRAVLQGKHERPRLRQRQQQRHSAPSAPPARARQLSLRLGVSVVAVVLIIVIVACTELRLVAAVMVSLARLLRMLQVMEGR